MPFFKPKFLLHDQASDFRRLKEQSDSQFLTFEFDSALNYEAPDLATRSDS